MRVARAAAAAAMSVAALAATAARADVPTPTSGLPVLPIDVRLASLTPQAPQPGDVLHVRGVLHNNGGSDVTNLDLQLRYRPAHLGSRSEFDDYARGSGGPPDAGGSPLPLPPVVAGSAKVSVAQRTLTVGATMPFDIAVPVDDLHLDQPWQVYELGVQVNGSTLTGGSAALGGLRTFLPWAPVGSDGAAVGVGTPVQVAWVWPLVDRPHRTVADAWTDDDLATSFAPGGRLGGLLAAGAAGENQQQPAPRAAKKRHKPHVPAHVVVTRPVPVTWAVDPMLVEDADVMSAGYQVGRGKAAFTGTGRGAARSWLQTLTAAAAKGQTLALPYADPDIVSATRSVLAQEVQAAVHSGDALVSRLLSTSPLPYVWAPDALMDQRALDAVFAAGVTTVVLDARSLPPVTEPNYTPGAATTVRARDGNLDALLTDNGLDTVIGIGADDPAKQPLAVQRYAAELLMIQAEQPNQRRTIVLAPDRHWAPAGDYATRLLTSTGKLPWVRPAPLSAAFGDGTSAAIPRQPLVYPPTERRLELPRHYLDEVGALKAKADAFAAILPRVGDPHARAFDDALLRTLSSAWRGASDVRDGYRDAVVNQLAQTMSKVRIASLPHSFVTLTSHSGTVPITVSNELDTPVRVVVQIFSQHLRVSGSGRTSETLPPHRQVAVDVRAEAKTSGVFPLTVRLLTPTGAVYTSTDLYVRSTVYGSVAILITAGATGVLLLAVIFRLVRRALAARRPTAAA